MINLDQLKGGMKLNRVMRFQTTNMLEDMSVAEHSYRGALLYMYLGGTEIAAMLTHDGDENQSGDIPGPTKRAGLVTVSHKLKDKYCVPFEDEKEKKLGKLCDILDLILHIRKQAKFDDELAQIYDEELDRVFELARELRKTREVKKILKEIK